MPYKVVYHVGDRVDPNTKLGSGRVAVSRDSLWLSGSSPLTLPFSSITGVELLRPHPRLSLMVKVMAGSSTVFLSVLLFRVFGDVFVTSQDGTIRLYDRLKKYCVVA